jgi:type VI secretion system Hcp family effector
VNELGYKSSPLLALGINENERYFLEFDFYRINPFGHFEKYYFIELRGASIVALQMNFDQL